MDRSDQFLPYGRQCIEEDDIEAVTAVLRGDWLTTGPAVEAFEKAFAERVGARFAVSCSSGTAGLHLAALALGLRASDVVIVPSMTFLATANAARFVGADVRFADVDPETGVMGPEQLDAVFKADSRQLERAVFPVYLNGQCRDPEGMAVQAREHGLHIVEDACHALGSNYTDSDGNRHAVGSCAHSDVCVFSFHAVKTIATGEGGMVTTNDPELNHKLRRFRNHGMTREQSEFSLKDEGIDTRGEILPWYYEMQELGYNYRISDFQCALGLSQLNKLDRFIAEREQLASAYETAFKRLNMKPLVRTLPRIAGCRPAWHLFPVKLNFNELAITRSQLVEKLRSDGVGTQVHYIPVHKQPYYRNLVGDIRRPGSESYYDSTLSLPLFVGMSTSDVDYVVEAIHRLVA